MSTNKLLILGCILILCAESMILGALCVLDSTHHRVPGWVFVASISALGVTLWGTGLMLIHDRNEG